jgi:porin
VLFRSTQEKSGLIALGLSWGEPSEENFGVGLEDQYTAELFYRMQILQSLTVTPDVQLLIDPALNPQEDVIAVFGVRGRLAF